MIAKCPKCKNNFKTKGRNRQIYCSFCLHQDQQELKQKMIYEEDEDIDTPEEEGEDKEEE